MGPQKVLAHNWPPEQQVFSLNYCRELVLKFESCTFSLEHWPPPHYPSNIGPQSFLVQIWPQESGKKTEYFDQFIIQNKNLV